MPKTWIDSKGVKHAYVPDAYYSFRQAWKRKQEAKAKVNVTMDSLATKFRKNTQSINKLQGIRYVNGKWVNVYAK